MRTVLTLGLLLAGSQLAEAAAPPAATRALTIQEQKEVGELKARLARHAAAGEFESAVTLARQIAEYRRQRQGARHWQRIDTLLEVDYWQRLTKVPAADRAAVVRARSENAEGLQLFGRGQYAKAEPKFREALAIFEKTLGPEYPDTAGIYNNVAGCLMSLGQAGKALPLCRRALDIRAKTLGQEHPYTAQTYNNVASCLQSQGQPGKALPLYQKALDICEKTLGQEHPYTAQTYNNVASCLHALGQADKALPLFQKALDTREKTLGLDHPDTAQSYHNVGSCLMSLGEADKALLLHQKALAIRERLGPDHPDTVTSYNNVGSCLLSLGLADKALPLAQKALDICEKRLGSDHLQTAPSYNNVALCLKSLGQASKALPLFQKALDIHKKTLGPNHPDTATSYNNVAYCLKSLGEVDKALLLHQKALAIREKRLGPDHPDTASSYNNMASCLLSLGQAGKALPLAQKALDIYEKRLGPDHPHTALSYNNVADCLHSLGETGKALPLAQKALDIYEKRLGPDHPDTVVCYNKVASYLQALGQADKALLLFQKALDIREKRLGPDHPDTVVCYNNLGSCLMSLGQADKALLLLQKALDIREKTPGPDHPDTASSYNNVGLCLKSLGQAGKALPLVQKALDIREKTLGPDDPQTASSYNNVAICLQALGEASKALPLAQKALDINEKRLGPEHPDTATSYNNVAYCLQALGQTDKALLLHQKALDINEKRLGPEHPDTASSYNNVAGCLQALGQAGKALLLYQKALAIWEKKLGFDDPHTAGSYNNVAYCLQALGQADKALLLHQKALAIREKRLGFDHPDTAQSYNNVAGSLWQLGRVPEAVRLLQASLPAQEAARFHLASSGFDRAVATSAKVSPHALLALGLARLGQPGNAFRHAEASLARGLLDDLAGESPTERDQLLALDASLRSLEAKLLPLLGRATLSAEQKSQREELSRQQRQLSSKLAQLAAAASSRQVLPLETIQQQLPADAALVFWLDLARPAEQHACVLRREVPPRWLRLPGTGKGDTWTAEDSTLPQRAYAALTDPTSNATERRRLLEALHRQRLAPLAPDLEGVRHLFVVPTGRMARVPVETLTDRYTISYVPSGSVLARLLEQHRPLRSSSLLVLADPAYTRTETLVPAAPPHGLLIQSMLPRSLAARARLRPGDVLLEYAGKALVKPDDLQPSKGEAQVPIRLWREGRTTQGRLPPGSLGVVVDPRPIAEALAAWRDERRRLLAARRGGPWEALPGTRLEAGLLTGLVPSAKLLLGSQASEQDLEALAVADQLKDYRLLHLAAHGQDNVQRPLETSLILAQDRLPASTDDEVASARRRDKVLDGRLTVGTVLQKWKLDADLVVLSACSSGLGRNTVGEGMLGFAQALLQKGAHTVVLSRWKADDSATALLMARFYENVLGKRTGLKAPLGRAEALQEARNWLRDLSREEALRQLGALSEGVPRGTPKYLPTVPSRPEAKGERPFEHPYYWASFVLLGDPD